MFNWILKKMQCEWVIWVHVAQCMNEWRNLIKTILNLCVP
jgi:hypothetical protein